MMMEATTSTHKTLMQRILSSRKCMKMYFRNLLMFLIIFAQLLQGLSKFLHFVTFSGFTQTLTPTLLQMITIIRLRVTIRKSESVMFAWQLLEMGS